MNKQNICPRCFTSGFNENCGTCGYRQEQALNQNVLRPFKVLQNRYIIGVPIGIGGFGITYAAQNAESGERIAVKEYFPQGIALRNADGTVQVVDGYRQAFRHGLERFSIIITGDTPLTEDELSEVIGRLRAVNDLTEHFPSELDTEEGGGTGYGRF